MLDMDLEGPGFQKTYQPILGLLGVQYVGPDMSFEVYFEAKIDNRCLNFTYFFNGMPF